MGKLLADQIAEIANKPAIADYDIEDNDAAIFEHRDHGSSDDDSDESQAEEQLEEKKAHYMNVGKSKIRSDAIEIKEPKYQGAKGSRKELFDAGAHNPGVDDFSSSEKEEREDGSEIEHSDAVSWRTDSEDEEVSEVESEDKSEEESEHENESKRDRLAKIVEEEAKHAMNRLSDTTQRDATKGLCIIEQSKLFDSILNVRMKLQKGVTAANSLPLTKESWSNYEANSPETGKILKNTTKLLERILGQMIEFRNEFQINDHISQTHIESSKKKKRTITELAVETERLDSELKDYRSAVLNKWSSKVNAASGKSMLNSSKFKAINQPSDVQVENQLSDMDRLIKRTCLSRRNVTPLGFQNDLKNGKLSHLEPSIAQKEMEDEAGDKLDIPKNYDPRRKDNSSIDSGENPYIFDDEDFYRVLLNDLVDKKISNAKNFQGGSATIAITSRSNNKLKKNIDTKASKGRKLNYSIQEAIANFEAPRDSGYKWSDEQIDEFFAGLFGQKINFDEDEEHTDDDPEAKGQVSAVINDDIQIFG